MNSRMNKKNILTMLSNIQDNDSGGEDEVSNENIEDDEFFPEIAE